MDKEKCKLDGCNKTKHPTLDVCPMHHWRKKHWGQYEKRDGYRLRSVEQLITPPEIITNHSSYYTSVHKWMRSRYGIPDKCQDTSCKHLSNNFEWANISGNYLRDIEDWKMLCTPCHRVFDKGDKCIRGHDLTDNVYTPPNTNQRRCRACHNLFQLKYGGKAQYVR